MFPILHRKKESNLILQLAYFCTDNRKHQETQIERKIEYVILFQMYFFSSSTKAKTVVADSAFAGNVMSIS